MASTGHCPACSGYHCGRDLDIENARARGVTLPPIRIVRADGRWMLTDGKHRLYVARKRGDAYIQASTGKETFVIALVELEHLQLTNAFGWAAPSSPKRRAVAPRDSAVEKIIARGERQRLAFNQALAKAQGRPS